MDGREIKRITLITNIHMFNFITFHVNSFRPLHVLQGPNPSSRAVQTAKTSGQNIPFGRL